MAEAKINESCIIGLPTCGYAFNSTRMVFIATPSDKEFKSELGKLQRLLKKKEYESYIAIQKLTPANLAFCTKICSKIITSQFCIVLLKSSTHKKHPEIKIPNPNVHLEYGLMMAFKKYIIPFQHEDDALAFNIRPLDTILYNKENFREKADHAIDNAIIKTETTSRPTRSITSIENLSKYISVLGLNLTQLNTLEASYLYKLGQPFGYSLWDGQGVVYFGPFDQVPAKEVVFRLKLLLQSLHNAKQQFDTVTSKNLTPTQIEQVHSLWARLRIEVFVSNQINKDKVSSRIDELTKDFQAIPWKLIDDNDIS